MPYVNYNKFTDITTEDILHNLSTDNRWVERALVVLYQKQTELERKAQATLAIENEVGFQVADALWFTRFAQRVLSRAAAGAAEGERLTERELAYCRRPWARGKRVIPAIGKYRKQIWHVINERERAKKLGTR